MGIHYLSVLTARNRPRTRQKDDFFSLAKNEEKRKAAGFEDGKFTNKKEE